MINPEITLAEVKKHLAITHTVNDDYILALIPTAVTNVEDTIDRSLNDVKCINVSIKSRLIIMETLLKSALFKILMRG